jgi:hypothetical protein
LLSGSRITNSRATSCSSIPSRTRPLAKSFAGTFGELWSLRADEWRLAAEDDLFLHALHFRPAIVHEHCGRARYGALLMKLA